MLKLTVPTALALLLCGASATAKEKLDPRIQAVLGCASVTDPAARLRCFDEKMAGLRQAVDSGQLISAEEASRPHALDGVITGAGVSGFNRFWVLMDSGDRWLLVASNSRDIGPKRGAKAHIRKGVMGAYWFEEANQSDRRAIYLGREMRGN